MPRFIMYCVGALFMASVATADELKLGTETKAPPESLAAGITAELSDTAIQLHNGGALVYEYWLRKVIPLKEKPESNEKALDAIEEVTLLGVMAAHEEKRDYRDDELWQDAYTMRFALQPQDGNHLGTSEFNYFAVLLAVKDDEALGGFSDAEAMIKTSSDNTAVGHPMIVSLRPVKNAEGDFPALKEPADHHKSVRVKATGKVADSGETVDFVFDIVYEGVGEL